MQDPELSANTTSGTISNVDWTRFNTFDEIQSWLDGRVSASPYLYNQVIGTSHQGRPLRCVRYSEQQVSYFSKTNLILNLTKLFRLGQPCYFH